jgi:thioredoxin 1
MATSKNVIQLNDRNFDAEVLRSDQPVLVDFGATWCGPCKALAPIVDKIADENVGTLKVAKVDIDESPGVAQRYGIRSAPTVLLFRGGEKKAQHVGLTTKEKLLKLLDS